MVAFNSSLLSIKVWFSPSATSSWQNFKNQNLNWTTNMMNYFLDFSVLFTGGLANSLFPRQLDEDGSRPWKWNCESPDHTLVTMKRNSSVSSPCQSVIMSSFGRNSWGILPPPPPPPSSVQLCWAPHLKVNSPIFFSLNVNSSIGVSKGIGPSTSATYREWIWRW